MRDTGYPNSTHGSILFILVLMAMPILFLGFVNHLVNENNQVTEKANAGPSATVSATTGTTPATDNRSGGQAHLEELIIKQFGAIDGRIFIAIQKFECNSDRKDYPKCTKWDHIEKSCGVSQINLDAHASKVKGDTLQEKCVNLYDIEYNLEIAYEIYEGWGSFNPWTAYKNGSYLKNL